MQVTQLFIYPIKSLGGIALNTSKIEQRGLQYDRRYMLVDENGNFLSQRQIPQLTLFHLTLLQNGFMVYYHEQQLQVPFVMSGPTEKVNIWEDVVEAVIADDTYNQWFSDCLGQQIRLVFMPQSAKRLVSADYAQHGEEVSFADAYPLLLLSEASLVMLNGKLSHPIGMDRFRPNMVIAGCEAHEEETWGLFQVGNALLKRVKPCARCVVTTINPQTGETGKEPLTTLSTYRMEANKIMFGENVLCLQEGEISIGDELVF